MMHASLLLTLLFTFAPQPQQAGELPPVVPPIWCVVSPERAVVHSEEPIWLQLECENRSESGIELDFQGGSGVGWRLSPEVVALRCFPRGVVENVPPARIEIGAGKRVTFRALLNRWAAKLTSGYYLLRLVSCAGAINDEYKGGEPLSQEVPLTVLPLDVPHLRAVCEDLTGATLNLANSPGARLQAAEALSWIDLPLAVPYLERVLLESGDGRRLLAAAGLGRVGSDEAVRVLVDAYEKGDVFTHLDLLSTLAGMRARVQDPKLRQRLEVLLQRQLPFGFED